MDESGEYRMQGGGEGQDPSVPLIGVHGYRMVLGPDGSWMSPTGEPDATQDPYDQAPETEIPMAHPIGVTDPTVTSNHRGRKIAAASMAAMLVTGIGFKVATAKGGKPSMAAAASTRVANDKLANSLAPSDPSGLEAILNSPLHEETNETLTSGGYNCGHTIELSPDSPYSYNNQIAYLNQKPELAANLIDFQVNDPTFGMGSAAWQVLQNEAILNSSTSSADVVASNADMNTYAHMMFDVALDQPGEFLNFTCSDPNTGAITPVEPVEEMKITGNVNGFMVTQQGLDDFQAVVNKYPDGQSKFDIVSVGNVNILDPSTGQTQSEAAFMIVTESEGCLNPNRAIPLPPKIPETTVPPTTPGTSPESTTPTTGVTTTTKPGKRPHPTTTTTTRPPRSTTTTTVPSTTTTTFVGPKNPVSSGPGGAPVTQVGPPSGEPLPPSQEVPTTSTTSTTAPSETSTTGPVETTTPTTVYIPTTTETTIPPGSGNNLP